MKPLVRVTQLEQYRRWRDQDEDSARFVLTEQDVVDSVTKAFEGNEYTRIGTAFHRIVEEGTPACEKVPEGQRVYTYYGKQKSEPVPCGRSFDVDGYSVVLDIAQIKTALAYRDEHPQAFHEVRLYKDYGDAVVTGCADMLDGTVIRDIKTKYGYVDDGDYRNSCQWRYYLELFEADTFCFDLFVFDGYNKERHGYDVRGLPLSRHEPAIVCHRYDRLEHDNRNLLQSFLYWAEYRNLTKYLIKEKI